MPPLLQEGPRSSARALAAVARMWNIGCRETSAAIDIGSSQDSDGDAPSHLKLQPAVKQEPADFDTVPADFETPSKRTRA